MPKRFTLQGIALRPKPSGLTKKPSRSSKVYKSSESALQQRALSASLGVSGFRVWGGGASGPYVRIGK